MIEHIQDWWDELVHNRLLAIVWDFPQWFHDGLLKATGYRVVEYRNARNGGAYRWELHNKFPPDSIILSYLASKVDPDPGPPDIVKQLQEVVERAKRQWYDL